jgi:hypothetical protein
MHLAVPPDVLADHNLLTDLTVGQIIALVGTIGIIIGFFKKINPIMHKLNDMIDDWNGRSARPGKDAEPGVLERLKTTEQTLTGQNEVLSTLRHKVEPIVDETQAGNHAEVLARLDSLVHHNETCGKHLSRMEKLLNRHIRESRAWVNAVDKATAERDFVTPPWPHLPDDEEDD